MNPVFADHVTNTAFFLSVSKKQMHMLLALEAHPWTKKGGHKDYFLGLENIPGKDSYLVTCRALEKKGLLEHKTTYREFKGKQVPQYHWKLTRAGELLCDLLREAGLAPELANGRKAA